MGGTGALTGPFELVILDCDGVLVDTERVAVPVDVRVLAAVGWEMTEAEVVERFLGRPDSYMAAELEARLGRPFAPGWDEEFVPWYRAAFEAELEPVAGVVDALDRIHAPTCVASSGTAEKIRFTLGLVGLYDRFAGRIFSVSDVPVGKPAPDLFLHAAASLGVDPSGCAVVEDSAPGVQAARAAGMTAFAYAGGLTPAERLAGPNTIVFDDMRDLPLLLGE